MGAGVVVDMHRSWGTRGTRDNRFTDAGESPPARRLRALVTMADHGARRPAPLGGHPADPDPWKASPLGSCTRTRLLATSERGGPHLVDRSNGLFAREFIPAGTAVSRVGGRLVSGTELQEAFDAASRDPEHPYIDTITVANDLHLILPPRRPNGYGNHSCDPNLRWIDAYTQAARLDIVPDEELTNDYATSTGIAGFRMDCRCGSPLCRGVITGTDWQRAELRERYGEHWTPGLLELIESGRAATASDVTVCHTPLST